MKCPLCGYEFDEKNSECHKECPLNKECSMVCCPSCHYQFVNESKTVNFIKKLFQKVEKSE